MDQDVLTLYLLAGVISMYADQLTEEAGQEGDLAFSAFETALECFDENLKKFEDSLNE